MLDINETIEQTRKELEKGKSEYKVIVHPSVISYDYRISWTWNEMEKRDKSNIEKDKLRLAFWMPARPYWKPLYSQRTTHRWKDRRFLEFWHWKTDLIGDWW